MYASVKIHVYEDIYMPSIYRRSLSIYPYYMIICNFSQFISYCFIFLLLHWKTCSCSEKIYVTFSNFSCSPSPLSLLPSLERNEFAQAYVSYTNMHYVCRRHHKPEFIFLLSLDSYINTGSPVYIQAEMNALVGMSQN